MFKHMPYENLGIIKVPERIARWSACIAVWYLQVCTEVGPKTYCSTVRALFTPGSQGSVSYRGQGSHARRAWARLPQRSTARMRKEEEEGTENKVAASGGGL